MAVTELGTEFTRAVSFLSSLQRGYLEQLPATTRSWAEARQDEEQIKLMPEIVRGLTGFWEKGSEEDLDGEEMFKEILSLRKLTPWEDRIFRHYLDQILTDLTAIQTDFENAACKKVLLSTAFTGSFNGFAMRIPHNSYRIVLLEDGLFIFLGLMCRIFAMVMPRTTIPDGRTATVLDISKALDEIGRNDSIFPATCDALGKYCFFGHPIAAKALFVPRERRQLFDPMLSDAIAFVLLHEFGHVVAGHLNSAPRPPTESEEPKNWELEHQADIIALSNLLKISGQKHGRSPNEVLWGVFAFFYSAWLLDLAVTTIQEGKANDNRASVSHPSQMRRIDTLMVYLGMIARSDDRIDPESAISQLECQRKFFHEIASGLWDSVAGHFLTLHRLGKRIMRPI